MNDLPLIAQCHRSAFPQSLSTAMGQPYLVKMLEWYLSSDTTFLFFLEVEGECVGYCGGMLIDGKAPMGSASGMTQYSFAEAVKAILLRPWLFFHREFRSKYKFIVKNIRMKFLRQIGKVQAQTFSTPLPPHAGLIVIGVASSFHGKGYGSLLLSHFETVARLRGYNHLMLTVLSYNDKAIKSYSRNGWFVTNSTPNVTTMEKNIK